MSAESASGDATRALAQDRLAATGMGFRPVDGEAKPKPAWTFRSADEAIEVAIYIADTQDDAVRTWEQLGAGAPGEGDFRHQAGISSGMVYEVRYVGPPEQAEEARYRVTGVAGALAGNE